MVFEQIEQLKRQYTDKYVVVDATRPELARFRDRTGQVKTVNMSGRALVQFDGGDNNIGWYDIGLDFLKVVDKPLPKPAAEEKPARETKPAAPAKSGGSAAPAPVGEKKPSVAEMARAGGAPKQSTADILAAARAKTAAAPKAEAPAAASKPATPAAPKSKPSTADILAAARGNAPAAAAPAEAAPAPKPEPVEEPVAETVADEVAAASPAPAPAAAPAKAAKGSLPKATADIVTWCRERDAK